MSSGMHFVGSPVDDSVLIGVVSSSALDAATSLNALAAYAFFNILLSGLSPPEWWGASLVDSEHCIPGS